MSVGTTLFIKRCIKYIHDTYPICKVLYNEGGESISSTVLRWNETRKNFTRPTYDFFSCIEDVKKSIVAMPLDIFVKGKGSHFNMLIISGDTIERFDPYGSIHPYFIPTTLDASVKLYIATRFPELKFYVPPRPVGPQFIEGSSKTCSAWSFWWLEKMLCGIKHPTCKLKLEAEREIIDFIAKINVGYE